jgi:hypothetical protein
LRYKSQLAEQPLENLLKTRSQNWSWISHWNIIGRFFW